MIPSFPHCPYSHHLSHPHHPHPHHGISPARPPPPRFSPSSPSASHKGCCCLCEIPPPCIYSARKLFTAYSLPSVQKSKPFCLLLNTSFLHFIPSSPLLQKSWADKMNDLGERIQVFGLRNDPKMPSIVFPGVCLGKYQLWRCQLREKFRTPTVASKTEKYFIILQIVWRNWPSGVLDSATQKCCQGGPGSFQFSFQSLSGLVSPGWCYFIFQITNIQNKKRGHFFSFPPNLGAVHFNQKSIANFLSLLLATLVSQAHAKPFSDLGVGPPDQSDSLFMVRLCSASPQLMPGLGREGNQKAEVC